MAIFAHLRRPALAASLVAALAIAACGGDDDDSPGQPQPGGGGATATSGAGGTTPAPGGGGGGGAGTATLTIGDESWTFSNLFCGFSPQETRNSRVSFTLSSFGRTDDDVRIQLDASIQDTREEGRYEGAGVIHSVTLNDVEDFDNPSVAWSAVTGIAGVGSAGFAVEVDGKRVTAEADFDDDRTDAVMEAVPGRLEATCP